MEYIHHVDNEKFIGQVVIKLPTFDQRYQYLEECGIDLDEKGDVKMSMKQVGAIRKLVKFSEAHYLKVDLKRKSDGALYSKFEEISVDPDCAGILIDIGTKFLGGFKLGN